jgi:hypothetical protein
MVMCRRWGKSPYKRTSGGPFAETTDLYGGKWTHLNWSIQRRLPKTPKRTFGTPIQIADTKVGFISATKQALSYLQVCAVLCIILYFRNLLQKQLLIETAFVVTRRIAILLLKSLAIIH